MQNFLRKCFSFAILLFISTNIHAQLVSNNAFLKGNFVEVGIAPCGSFGSSVSAPTGYHPRGTGTSSSATQLGFVANVAQNNWNTFVGDYFLPGTPEEGWGMTINGTSYTNSLICNSALNSNQIQGGFTAYSSSASEVSATWQGIIGGLSISSRTYIPMNSLYFITEVTITNTSSLPVNNIYYMRNVDPDQGVLTPGGGGTFITRNTIVNQTPNSCNQALVSAVTQTGNYYLGLGSIDARARVTHGGFSNRSAIDIWNGTGFSTSGTIVADRAISIAFNIGNLQPNQSTKVAYAYILDAAQLTQALAATNINLNLDGVNVSSGNISNVCSGTAVPITLSNTGSFTNWTWSPATGLNTTTGTSVIATLTAPITYTATGVGDCGTTSVTIVLNPVIQSPPNNAGAISGLPVIGLGQTNVTFSIPPVPNATYYTWTLPPGAVITSAKPDSNVITFNAPNSTWCGNVSVTPKNSCSSGGSSSISTCISNISTGSVASPICGGSTVNVPISTPLGFFLSTNVFTAQLSDTNGSFTNPTNIGTLNGNSSGFISTSIPANILSGTRYRIRVISSNPATIGTDNGADLVINNAQTPTIQISANQNNLCSGTTITFTAAITAGGTTPIFQWRKNGNNVGTNAITYTDNGLIAGDIISCVLTSNAICATVTTATSNSITLTGTPGTPSISITSNVNNICSGSPVTFTANAVNGGTTPIYQWRKNGNNVGTNSPTYTDNTLITTDIITCVLTSNATCSVNTTATSNNLSVTVNNNLVPSVNIAASQNSVCSGSNVSIVFTATAVNGGTNPTYQWKVNGVNVGTNTNTYSTNTLGGTDVVTCVLTSSATCVTTQSATSNALSIIIIPAITPDIDITASQTAICIGTPATITFTATATNTGAAPIYQWKKNGVNVGTNSPTYTDNSFTNNTVITCFLTANNSGVCVTSDTLTSNEIVITVNNVLTPNINITTTSTNVCNGAAVTFSTTIINGGTSPSYQWRKNGVNVGTNASVYTDNTLITGDQISCVLTSNFPCVTTTTRTSNTLTMNVNPSVVPSVEVSASQTVICSGTTPIITFRATGTNAGTPPQYRWLKNDVLFGIGINFSTANVVAGDVFKCVLVSNANCAVPTTDTSSSLTITGASTAIPTLSIFTPQTNICANTNVTFTAITTNGGNLPQISWFRNGNLVQQSNSLTYSNNALNNNDIITCSMQSNLICASPTFVNSSNSITMTVTPRLTPSVTIVADQNPICTGSVASMTFTATIVNGGTNPTYQWFKNGVSVGTNSNTYIDNAPSNSSSVVCRLINSTSTCLTSTSVFSNTIIQQVSNGVTPSISISATSNSICAGTLVTFNAFISNGGTNPTYQWKKNGINVGTNSSTYSDATLTSSDIIACQLTSNLDCLAANNVLSNTVSVTVNPNTNLSLVITSSQSVLCNGQATNVFYTATSNEPSILKTFTWKKNGGVVINSNGFATNSTSISVLPTDIVTCEITNSNATCATYPIVSNSLQLPAAPAATPTISISAVTNTSICTGGFVTFTANTTNGGTVPNFQWRRNGILIASNNSSTYNFFGLLNGDVVTCRMTSNLSCVTGGAVISNGITVTVSPILTPSVTVSASQSNVCAGTNITFTANPVNGGSAPTYTWTKNNITISGATSNTYASNNFITGDVIRCTMISSETCVSTTSPVTSTNSISLVVTGDIPIVTISTPLNTFCAGSNSATFTATATNAGSSPIYQWRKNGINVGTNSATYTDNNIANNDTISCNLTSSTTCPATVSSNKIGLRVINVLAPTVNGPFNITCGDTATLAATTTGTNTLLRWFNTLSGGTSIGTGNSLRVAPTNTTTYYAEAFENISGSRVDSIRTIGALTANLTPLGGSIASNGIAASPNFAYISCVSSVVRFNKNTLTIGTALPTRTMFFSNLLNGDLWQLGNDVSNGNSFSTGIISRLYRLDENLNPTGTFLTLSQSFNLNSFWSMIAPGEGYLLILDYNTATCRRIDLITGVVTILSPSNLNSINFNGINGIAYGWAEFDGTDYFVQYRINNSISRTNCRTGAVSIVQDFTNLGSSMGNVLYDPTIRKIFAASSSNQFTALNNSIFSLNALTSVNSLTTSCSSTRIPVTVNVAPIVPTITASGATTLCSTGSLILTASAGTSYQWTRNGNTITGANSQTYSPTQSGNYAVNVTSSNGCTGVSVETVVTVNVPVTPSVSITANQTTICSGTTITFTAVPVNGGTSPSYQWRKNGNNVGTNASTFSDNTLVNGDVVSCVLTSNATCISTTTASSNSITLTVNSAVPSVSITSTQTSICAGTNVTFTATPINGGTSPIYQWRKNGNNVGTNASTYSDNALANNDVITCVLTSNANCASTAPVTSNSINIIVTTVSTPTISIAASQNNICSGVSVTFTASITGGGTNPIYQWRRNGVNVGTNASTYSSNILTNGDLITCQLTSNLPCATSSTIASNTVSMVINAIVTPSITISTPQTSICAGSSVVFTATTNNAGTNPTYQWRKNGNNVGTNSSTYTDAALAQNDIITCVITSNANCASPINVTSNIIRMLVTANVTPSVTISTLGSPICGGFSTNIIATPTNGGFAPTYQWFKNGSPIVGFTGSNIFVDLISGDVISCIMTSSLTCVTNRTVPSNNLTVTVLPFVPIQLNVTASETTICNGSSVTFTTAGINIGTTPTYQWFRNGIPISGAISSTLTTSLINNNEQFSCTVSNINTPCVGSTVVNSNSVTITVIPPASVSVSTNATTLCNGNNSATFTATPSNAGIAPTYQWKKNGNNVGTNLNTYTDNALAQNDSIWCVLTPNGTCTNTAISNKIGINLLTITNPIVTSPVNVNCGDSVTLSATLASGNQVRWFTSATSTTPIALGNNSKVFTNINTTYFGESFVGSTSKSVTSIATSGATIIDHDAITGDDRCGIVVSPNFIYVVGDNFTGRYNKSNLTGGVSLTLRDGFFSNIGNGDLWQLGNASTNGTSFGGGNVDRLFKLDENLLVTGSPLILSQSISVTGGNFLAAGDGFVILYNQSPNSCWHINLTNGVVTTLSNTLSFSFTGSEGWASYGWAENIGNEFFIVYATNTAIRRINVVTGVITTVQTFSNIGETANITLDPQTDRMYFHYENTTQFGGFSETLGFVNVTSTITSGAASSCVSTRVPINVVVASGPVPTISASGSTTFCASQSLTLTASNGTSFQWIRNGNNITGATNQTFNPTQTGDYTVRVTTSNGCTNTSLATTVTVNNQVTPSITIVANQTTICAGTNIVFTANIINGGTTPSYQWRKNGNNVGTNSNNYSDNTLVSGDIISCILTSSETCATSTSATSNNLTMTVSSAIPSISIQASQTSICAATNVTFTAVAVNGGTSPIYQWYKNGNTVGTNAATYTDNALANGDAIICELTSNATCATTSNVISNGIIMVVTPVVTPSISISTSQTTVCGGTNVVFTATPTNAGSSPIYQWRKNGINVGTNATVYSDNTLINGDVISCQLTNNAVCVTTNTVNSNSITMTINAVVIPTIAISTAQTSICTGTSTTFTATATNIGSSPIYQWRKNGNLVGGNSTTYTDNTLINGNTITCTLISNANCASPTSVASNTITMTVNTRLNASVSISGSNNICAGASVTFNATITNGGTGPIFQWRKNGINVGSNSSTYTASSLVNGDVISCVAVSNRPCVNNPTVTSNNITMVVNPITTPSVSIVSNISSVCSGSAVVFTATAINGGTSPSYSWFVNGVSVPSSGRILNTTTLPAGTPTIVCILNSNASCATTNTSTSNTLTITVTPSVLPTVTVFTPTTNIVAGQSVTFTAVATNGGTSPLYQWRRNGFNIGTSSSSNTYTTNTLINGDVISCVLTSNATCATPTTATSNNVNMIVNSNYALRGRMIYPNNLPIPRVWTKVNTTDSVLTSSDGSYNFSLLANNNYTITPSKNNDVAKSSGVNIFDILFMQRHIGGTSLLNTPYKIMAADVDNSGAVNIFDVIRTRRLILGTDTTFPGNRLWAFVDSSYVFPDPTNPSNTYKTTITINNLSANQNNQTFYGVKLGDVNLDLVPTEGVNRDARFGTPVKLYYDTVYSNQNDKQIKLSIKTQNFTSLLGMQFTLGFNQHTLAFSKVNSKQIAVEYGAQQAQNGLISFIWTDSTTTQKTLPDGTILFELIFDKIGDITNEDISINSFITQALAVNNSYVASDVQKGKGVIVGIKEPIYTTDKFEISPNPTSTGWVKVKIQAIEDKEITLIFTDVRGRLLMQKRMGIFKGMNEFMLNLHQPTFRGHGTYYLKALGLKGKDVLPIIIAK
jgi:hypothetical protein